MVRAIISPGGEPIVSDVIKLIEVADTWQGEGPDTGRQMMIARFKYCNKQCAFCDTMVRMKTMAEGSYTIEDLNSALAKTRGLMITGGEPTHVKNYDQTISMLLGCKYDVVNIETNGYQLKRLTEDVESMLAIASKIKIMYSPKVFSQKDYDEEVLKFSFIWDYSNIFVKIVADPNNKFTEQYIRDIAKNNKYNSGKIYLMPLGVTKDEIAKNWDYCINLADELHLNISTRMHIMNDFT